MWNSRTPWLIGTKFHTTIILYSKLAAPMILLKIWVSERYKHTCISKWPSFLYVCSHTYIHKHTCTNTPTQDVPKATFPNIGVWLYQNICGVLPEIQIHRLYNTASNLNLLKDRALDFFFFRTIFAFRCEGSLGDLMMAILCSSINL